ncbi:MAG: hypothetical protein M3Q76_00710 [Acidobacteriota bacterium]|nr:hypothetical protein [Acidobacteriota bacterium]
MNRLAQFQATLDTYRKHGWRLERVLMCPRTLAELQSALPSIAAAAPPAFENVVTREAAFDAMWFARASHAGREAWELRLISDPPYALFELFEPDEAEEDREDVRREMEAKAGMRDEGGGMKVEEAEGSEQ